VNPVDGLGKRYRDYTDIDDYSAAEHNIKHFGGIEYAVHFPKK
jgi:hypothetical protein